MDPSSPYNQQSQTSQSNQAGQNYQQRPYYNDYQTQFFPYYPVSSPGQVNQVNQMPNQSQVQVPQVAPQVGQQIPQVGGQYASYNIPPQIQAPISDKPVKPRVATTFWEDENTICYQVEARGIQVSRREDTNFINGTKLLNVAGMTRGRRDGILKTEKIRYVVKIGAMNLKGVWIPFERALELARNEGISDLLYPLFVKDIKTFYQGPGSIMTSNHPLPRGDPTMPININPISQQMPYYYQNYQYPYYGQQQQQQQPSIPSSSSSAQPAANQVAQGQQPSQVTPQQPVLPQSSSTPSNANPNQANLANIGRSSVNPGYYYNYQNQENFKK